MTQKNLKDDGQHFDLYHQGDGQHFDLYHQGTFLSPHAIIDGF